MSPRRSRGRRLVLVAVAAVALVLAACSEVKNNGQNSLEPKGPQAQKIYDLFVPILIIANDREYMGDEVNGRAMNFVGQVYLVIILAAAIAAIPLLIVTGAGA